MYYSPEKVTDLATGVEWLDNSFSTRRIDVQTEYSAAYHAHAVKAGVNIRYSKSESSLDESGSYLGIDSVIYSSKYAKQISNTRNNSLSAFIEDNILLTGSLSANAGVRVLKYYFNGEVLLSPRAELSFKPDPIHSVSLSWGYYYQPPYFYEIWDKDLSTATSLRAQRNIQYNLSWEYRFKERAKFTTEVYYKNLSRLIPYTVDQLQLTYGDKNNHEGFAYGMDLQYEGELVPGLQTWLGYSYLHARERETTGNAQYEDSPLDQTHTIRIFLQDHARSHPNFQAHVLFLVGTGYHYYPMMSVPGSSPGSYQIVPNYSRTEEYPFYFRVDMGLSYELSFLADRKVTLTAEVLNVFSKNNVTSYSWFNVFRKSTQPVPVPNILSPRFFNVGLKFDF